MKDSYLNTDYMTVGEVAAKAGLTVRTVQYYDQQGLLSPSAKGSRNLRLYTGEDLERLYRILCYKELGLSIKEIRLKLEEEQRPGEIIRRLKEEIGSEKEQLLNSVKRYAALKNLESYILDNEVTSWQDLSDLMEFLQIKWSLIWDFNLDSEEAVQKQPSNKTRQSLLPYYTLIEETVQLMREGLPPDSEEAMDLMGRFEALFSKKRDEALLSVDPELLNLWREDYTALWQGIKEYMREAEGYYLKREEGKK